MASTRLAVCLLLALAGRIVLAAAPATSLTGGRRLAEARRAPLGMADAVKSKDLRVLAFGDSITEGWINTQQTKHPYTWRLEPMLRNLLEPKGIHVSVTNGGVGSAGVLDRLNDAFLEDLRAARDAGRPYHYVVFLAGINDILLQHRSADEIIGRMKDLWAAAAKDGSTVVVIPTLPTFVKAGEPVRRDLVKSIKAAVRDANGAGDKSLHLLDLERKFDWYRMEPSERGKVFDDGVHLTDFGYQQMLAPAIYQGLVKVMGKI